MSGSGGGQGRLGLLRLVFEQRRLALRDAEDRLETLLAELRDRIDALDDVIGNDPRDDADDTDETDEEDAREIIDYRRDPRSTTSYARSVGKLRRSSGGAWRSR